jgi:penicillin-binding protein 2
MGRNGRRTAQVNSLGREVEDPKLRLPGVGIQAEPVPGKPLALNLDMDLQTILENAFAGETGSAIFMNPNTGEILAWVSLPEFNPNLFSSSVSAKAWKALVEDPGHPLLNRPIQGSYPPGSTFKPFIALVGLQEGILSSSTAFSCGGVWEYGGHPFHCWSKGHGTIDLLTAIQNSCNIYFYHAGDRIGIGRLDKWGRLFGLGQKTGVDLPGEMSGVLGSPEWKAERGMGPWYPGETLPVSIGQGYLTVTPLQLLSFYSTLATGGTRCRPRLISGPPEVLSTVALSPEALGVVKEGLARVVSSGTGKACRLPGVDVCAKTGTAQVVEASAGKNTYSLDKGERDHAWFAGFAPRNDPTVAFVVMVEHGGHGGDVGARIAKLGLEYLFFGKKPGEEMGPPKPEGFQPSPEREPEVPTDLPPEVSPPTEEPLPEWIPQAPPAGDGQAAGVAP